MKKKILPWSIADLQKRASQIEFGEYQREPSVWDVDKKRRLIDSILRSYDISSIYFYEKEKNRYECIDGRQRINAIFSFLGINLTDEVNQLDNHFLFRSSDELFGKKMLTDFDGKRFIKLKDDEAGEFFSEEQRTKILEYQLNVIELTELESESDLHLMFLRLQLGAALNAGEKLNAMKGEMRDFIFKRLGRHPFFQNLVIPQKRFSKEQTAAQVALQYFSLLDHEEFHKARFSDMQDFFKDRSTLTAGERIRCDELYAALTQVTKALSESKHRVELKNRAMGVSLFFVVNELYKTGKEDQVDEFLKFLQKFQSTVKGQVKLGIDIEPRYRGLLRFQTYITQAAVEKYAIEGRQNMLLSYFQYYLEHHGIKEDTAD